MFDTNADSILDLAYVASDQITTGGGLKKYTFDGETETWTNQWSLLQNANGTLSGTSAGGFAGIRGLAGTFSDVVATLFATTTESNNNRLISIIDAGTTPTTFTTLQSAGTNVVFRGVDIAVVPEPSTVALAAAGIALARLGARKRRRAASSRSARDVGIVMDVQDLVPVGRRVPGGPARGDGPAPAREFPGVREGISAG